MLKMSADPQPTIERIEQLRNIPDELQQEDSGWYFYDFDSDDDRAPRNPDGSYAYWSSGDDGVSFDKALKLLIERDDFDTIGYRFTEEDDYLYMDFDGCLSESYNLDSVKDWSVKVESFGRDTYTEFSSSGTGVHVFYKGDIPNWWEDAEIDDEEHEGVEIFDSRLCIFTGDQIGETDEIIHTDDLKNYDWADDLLLRIYEKIEGKAPPAFQDTEDHTGDTADTRQITSDVTEALDRIDPYDIDDVIWSEYQGDRGDFEEWDPAYRDSKSGTSLMRNKSNNTWFDFKYGYEDADDIFGILRLFASERGRIQKPTDKLKGEEWVNCYKNFKSKVAECGIELPELGQNDLTSVDPDGWSDIQAMYSEATTKDERGTCDMMAVEQLRSEKDYITIRDTDELYYYDDGVYHDNGEQIIRENLVQGLRNHYTSRRASNIEDKLRGLTGVDRDDVGISEPLVTVENGVLGVVSRELTEHSSKHNALNKLPVEFEPEADEPEVFLDYLTDVVPEEEQRKKLQEFVGYTLLHWGVPFEKCLFLVGGTNSGKSTFIDVVNMLHDEEAVSHVTPQEVLQQRFKSAQLYGSWLNTQNEIPNETVGNVGKFKKIVSGEEMVMEKKNQPNFNHDPNTKHIYAGNQLPTSSVDDQAFYERILLISFPNTIPREEQDRRLLQKIEDELPGVLNWALEGLDRLMSEGLFTADRSASETEEMWEKWSSSVKRFAHECLEVTGDSDDYYAKGLLMKMFEEYASRRGMPSSSKQTFTKTITANPKVTHTRTGGTDGTGSIEGIELTELGLALQNLIVTDDEESEEEVEELLDSN